jgi:subtilisin family serine protease
VALSLALPTLPSEAAEPAPAAAGETLLVRFRSSLSASQADSVIRSQGARVKRHLPGTGFTEVLTGGRPVEEVRRELLASPAVTEVQPNHLRRAAAVASDPAYSNWQAPYFEAAGIAGAWDVTTGRDDLVVAVVDSGVDLDHPDLAARLVPGFDFVNNDTRPDDDLGHGTMVAGVVAAQANNGAGGTGVTWRGRIMPIKVLDEDGIGNDYDIAAGIVWAAEHGASVINLSLGGPGASPILQKAIDRAVELNAVVVAAAGNDNSTEPNWPAAANGAVAVGATNRSNARARFSNYGSWLDLMAPGVGIYSTAVGGDYSAGEGTSYSTPIVSGVALLARSADRGASAGTIVERLRRGAKDLGAPGFDSEYGAGLVNALATLQLGPGAVSPAGNCCSISGVDAGYWMLGLDGLVYAFGNASGAGDPSSHLAAAGVAATDIEPSPSGNGYWVLSERGAVFSYGDARYKGGLPDGYLAPGETATSLSATPSGDGYWIFTTRGRAAHFGDAVFLGDMRAVRLNGPVLDSVATPTGGGYYMVAADGGIFTFGDARFHGSMGDKPLNAPVRSLVPDPDQTGYWLVASDGGVFTFLADFRGSMGGTRLNKPVTGMVAFGNGYLMVASDGGVFNFSDKPFAGSLGSNPPAYPIVALAPRP